MGTAFWAISELNCIEQKYAWQYFIIEVRNYFSQTYFVKHSILKETFQMTCQDLT